MIDLPCPSCGTQLPAGTTTCPNCGASLANAEPNPIPRRLRRSTRIAIIGAVLGVFVTLLLCNSLIFLDIALVSPAALILSLLAAVVPATFYSSAVVLLDRYEREPFWILLGTFLWGALVATLFSYFANTFFAIIVYVIAGEELAEVLSAAISAPIVEETAKGAVLVLLLLFFRREFDNVLDGIVYGSLVGIGFAMTENVLYFGRAFLEGSIVGLALSVYLRSLLGGLGHAAYTATFGAGLGIARESQQRAVKIIAPLAGWVLAVFQHFAWNLFGAYLIPSLFIGSLDTVEGALIFLFVTMPIISFTFTAPAVLTLLVLVGMAWRRETRILREELREEVERGVVTAEEYARLTSGSRRLVAELTTLTRHGFGAWLVLRRLHQAETELAFRKWHLSRGEMPKRGQKHVPEAEYRRRIVALRARLTPVAPLPATPPAA